MCGIAGAFLRPHVRLDANAAVQRMCNRMRARGPDAAGDWSDPNGRCVLGHRRLSIIDPDPRSNQPMTSEDGRFVIVLNGEIYNYVELRRDLERRGCVFRTGSDTEVMLELLSRDGVGAVERLRGMFAFALWDKEALTLSLGRDPYGIKPLYFADTEAGVLFASQVKALTASGVIPQTIDRPESPVFFCGAVSPSLSPSMTRLRRSRPEALSQSALAGRRVSLTTPIYRGFGSSRPRGSARIGWVTGFVKASLTRCAPI